MSNGLLEQLAEYGSATRSGREPVTSADVFDASGRIRVIEQRRVRTTRPRWYVAVAVAIVTVVAFGTVALLADRVGEPPAADDTPVSVTQPPDTFAPSTTVALDDTAPPTTVPAEDAAPPTTVASESAVLPTPVAVNSVDDWLTLPQPALGAAGTYRTGEFDAGFAFTVPNGWSTELDQAEGVDRTGLVWLIPMVGDHGTEHIWFLISAEESVDAVVDQWLEASDERDARMIETVPPVDVVIGGAHGKTLQMEQTVLQLKPQTVGSSLDGDDHKFEDLGLPDLFDRSLDFGQPTYVHVLSVGDETVIVWVQTGEFVALPGVRNEFFDTAQAVLDSIVWRDLLN